MNETLTLDLPKTALPRRAGQCCACSKACAAGRWN